MRRGTAAVAGASFIVAIVLVAGPLYLASVGSAAVQRQFDERCPARIGLSLPGSPGFDPDRMARAVEPHVAGVDTIGPTVRTFVSTQPLLLDGIAEGVDNRFRLLHRDGALDDLEIVAGPVGSGVWLPAAWADGAGLGPGDTIRFDNGVGTTILPVAATYRDLVSVTPPRAWCTQSDVLRPNAFGDPPPPVVVLDDATLESLPRAVTVWLAVTDELPVRREDLTLPDATSLAATFAESSTAHALRVQASMGANRLPVNLIPRATTDLPFVVRRAHGIVDLVDANVVPVRLAGGLAGAALAVAAGALATRRRAAELTTRAVRGEGPIRLGVRVAVEAAPAAMLGAVAGGVAALLAVRVVGPSTDLGPVAGVVITWIAVASAVAIAAVGLAAGLDARRLADAPGPLRLPRWVAAVPWEVVPLACVAVAGLRLRTVGGAQFVGDETTGSDAVALSFPVLSAVAIALLLLRPVARMARALRHRPRDADPALVLGARRLAFDPAGAAGIAAAIALASATTVLGASFAASAEDGLRAKAATFVGSDVAVTIAGTDRTVPAALAGRATVVERVVAHSGDQRVELLAVDPATFAAGAGATRDQAELVASLGSVGASGRVPAIVVGDLPDDELRLVYDLTLPIRAVATPDRFPTMRRGAPLVIVRQDALAPEVAAGAVVLARGDAAEVEAALRDAGLLVTGVASPGEVISATSFAAVGWAYNALRALGALVVVVLIGVELATAAARAPLRRVAEVLTSAMGLSRRRAVLAVALEHGAPLVLGAGVGVLAARVVAAVAVPRLDSARTIPPVATTVVPLSAVGAVAAVGLAAVAVATYASRRLATRAAPVEVLRGG